jgi:hypothetical protein
MFLNGIIFDRYDFAVKEAFLDKTSDGVNTRTIEETRW